MCTRPLPRPYLAQQRALAPTFIYGGPEGHSPVDGSRVRTLTIDQSTIDGWTFKPLIIEHQAHSDDRRSMVGHSSHQPLTIEQHAHSEDRRSMVRHSNHQPLIIEQQAHSDDRRLDIQTTNHSPSSSSGTLTIDGRWLDIQTTHHRVACAL